MNTIPQLNVVASLPVAELNESLRLFLEPVTSLWPDAQLKAVAELLVQGVVSSQSPLVTQMARGVSHPEETIWPTCQRVYRFLGNERFNHWTLQKGLYRVGQVTVAEQRPEYLVIAVDPVNFEKPYTAKLEGVSTVIKSRPPSFTGEKRKTRGYPAITATVVNLKQPAVSYAQCGNASGGCPGGFVIRAVVGRQYYRPYGGPRGAAVALPTDRAFTGQVRDATGLDYFRARYFSSSLGRFVSADSIVPQPKNPQTLNRFAYANNNPLRHTDPTGHFNEDEIMKFLGADTWDQVLGLFEQGGVLEGRWGWLEVLRQAQFDDILLLGDQGNIRGHFTFNYELALQEPGQLSWLVSAIGAGQQYDHYQLIRANSDPMADFVRCGGYPCLSGNSFTTSAYTRYDRIRPRWHKIDVLGLYLDGAGLFTAGAGDDIIKWFGQGAGKAIEWAINLADAGYGADRFVDDYSRGTAGPLDVIGLMTDIGGVLWQGPVGIVLDAAGIATNIGNAWYYGP